MTNKEFSEVLLDLAAIYEANVDVPQLYSLSKGGDFVFCHSKETFDAAFRVFGPGDEIPSDDSLMLRSHRFPAIKVSGFTASVYPVAKNSDTEECPF